MRRRKRSDPRKKIAFGIIAALAILVGIAVIIDQVEKGSGKPIPVGKHKPAPHPSAGVMKEYPFPELLIKGCLFDLGVERPDIRFTGYTVHVTPKDLPPSARILKAFEPLRDVGEVGMDGPDKLRVNLNGNEWDIVFTPSQPGLAKCAIIIDDMGQSLQTAEQLGAIDANLTFAVLPDSPESKQVAEYLHRKGREILLHLPMQGSGKNPGPGAILEGMTPDAVRAVIREDLKQIPFFVGVNNHMGSVITADPQDMRLVFNELKQEKLFFVDSRTTNKSVCGDVAREFQVPFAARDVFLDNERNAAYITGQIQKLVSLSLKHTGAVGICHPHPETIAVLEKEVPKLRELGVEVVRVSSLTERPESAR
jgi:polysaccharide deacetylase 2 family uncharacterized protein YibQ